MHEAISRLLSISSEAVGDSLGDGKECRAYLNRWGRLGRELADLLHRRNGFYAYESSLLVRPFRRATAPLGIVEWNAPDLWKGTYRENLEAVLCFAEDIFGCQFCICGETVCAFDPETGEIDKLGESLTCWARTIVDDFEYRTGFPLAHSWQMQNGPVPQGMRLVPKLFFVLGGAYDVQNLYALEDVKGMLFRSSIANQISELPDGAEIVLEVVNKQRTEE